MKKSSRHAKLTGDFGESIILYWLSTQGYECAKVDHVGIDIIARPKQDGEPVGEMMGISVKSRSRNQRTEDQSISVPKEHLDDVEAACRVFGCRPFFGFVADGGGFVRGFIAPIDLVRRNTGTVVATWKMSKRNLETYADDSSIMKFELAWGTGWREEDGQEHDSAT